MRNNLKLEIKPGMELTEQELREINCAKAREWKIPPMDEKHRKKEYFALLKDSAGNIVAQGELIPLDNVTFDNKTYSIVGIGGIIANKKGCGFGKRLMEGIKEYLKREKKAGLGFTGNDTIWFYVKSGYRADQSLLKRFVHLRGGKKITNQDQEVVFYADSDDDFMKKVLSCPQFEVFLPRDPDW